MKYSTHCSPLSRLEYSPIWIKTTIAIIIHHSAFHIIINSSLVVTGQLMFNLLLSLLRWHSNIIILQYYSLYDMWWTREANFFLLFKYWINILKIVRLLNGAPVALSVDPCDYVSCWELVEKLTMIKCIIASCHSEHTGYLLQIHSKGPIWLM